LRIFAKRQVVLVGIALLTILSPVARSTLAQGAETPAVSLEVQSLMDQMTSQEKVGQLFLITFVGNDLSPGSDIARLIQRSRVGGVVLSPGNGNFINNEGAPERVVALANGLQTLALTAPLTTTAAPTSTIYTPIPLLIALNEEGDEYPYTSLWNGLTLLPDAMALGATWAPAYAEQVGEIVGRELGAVGVNMLLGPSLDVLDRPRPTLPGISGTRTFGGDPYWVSKFGQAYIRGVHKGGEGKMLTVAKHFPGLGGADRNPNEELPTIQKSLETLRSIELVPFFSVTTFRPDDPLATTDALMSSHVRYRGFQGNIRQLSRPISLDAQNLPTILNLPEFAPWRKAGGLLVSQELGVPSIRKFYDPSLQTFPAKRIAQEAFLAGNDLLYLSRFDLTDNWKSQLANIEATILFFRDKYDTDVSFKARVDESVARILQHKLTMYGQFRLENVLQPTTGLRDILGQGGSVVARIAQEAATLIYPTADELSGRLPSPPLSDEKILIITDDRTAQECVGCVPFYYINPQSIRNLILKLYGPEATGQVTAEQVSSLTFHQLKQLLSPASTTGPGTEARPTQVVPTAVASATPVQTPETPAAPTWVSPIETPTPPLPPQLQGTTAGATPTQKTLTVMPVRTASAPTVPAPVSPLGTPTAEPIPTRQVTAEVTPTRLVPTETGTAEVTQTQIVAAQEKMVRDADWIIFAMLDVNVGQYPDSDAVKLFLRERSDMLQGKKLVVLAFNAPYFLDATEVSKLTAYYGLYSRTAPFIETAVRLLFQEFQPRGASPVDVDAIGYQMIEVTRPDPNQVINIDVVTGAQSGTATPTTTPQVSPEGTPIPIKLDLKVGDVLTLRTSKIVDRNGRPVPDGTLVEFRLLDTVQSLEARLPVVTTVDGVATVNFNLARSGTWQITAASDTAQRSVRLIVTIPEKGPVEVGIDRPTPTPTDTPTPSPTPTPTPTITPTPTNTPLPPTATPTTMATVTPTLTPVPVPQSPGKAVNALGFALSVVCLALVGSLSYRWRARQSVAPHERMKRSLIAGAAGLVGYVLFGIGLIPLERLPFVARAVRLWLPYEMLPVMVCLVFSLLAQWLAGVPRVRRWARMILSGHPD
jgi:beta-glucosidase-like glycosyl hydrolase